MDELDILSSSSDYEVAGDTPLPSMDDVAVYTEADRPYEDQRFQAEYQFDRPNVFDIGGAVSDNDWVTSAIWRGLRGLTDPGEIDEDWDSSEDSNIQSLLTEYNIPVSEMFVRRLRETASQAHARRVASRMQQELDNERTISRYFDGNTGAAFGARLGISLFDPASWVAGSIASKAAMAGTTARQAMRFRTVLANSTAMSDDAVQAAVAVPTLSRADHAMRNTIAAAAADGSLEYYHISQSPTAHSDDMVIAGLGVLATAGVFGHLGYSSARRSIYTRAGAEVESELVARMEASAVDDIAATDANWDPFGGSSVGANRNPEGPYNSEGDVVTNPFVEEFDPGQGSNFGNLARFDAYAMFNRSRSGTIRALGNAIFEDGAASSATAGRAQHHTVELLAGRHERVFGARFARAMAGAFDVHKSNNNIGMAADAIQAEHYNNFSRDVARAVRGDPSVNVTPEIAQARDAFRASMRDQLSEAQAHGILDGVEPNDNYVPRFWRREAFLELMDDANLGRQAGEDVLATVIARSIRGVDLETADSIARHVIKVITRNDINNETLSRMGNMSPEAVRAKLRGLLGDVDDDTLDAVNSVLGLQGGKKRAEDGPRGESRLDIDESTEVRLNGRTFRLDDLFNNDLLSINTMYSRQIGGRVGFSKATGGKIKSTSDIEKLLAEATEEALVLEGGAQKIEMSNIARMKAYADYLLGHGSLADNPHLSEDTQAFMKFLRDVSFARLMGQVGYSQMSEIGTAVGALGFRAFLAQAPRALRHVFSNYKPGASVSHDNLVGVLSDTLALGDMHIQARMRTMSRQLDSENAYGARDNTPGSSGTQTAVGGAPPEQGWRAKAGLAARIGELGARATSLLGGLQPITDFSQMATATALIAQFARNAKAGQALNTHVWGINQNAGRLLGMGIDDEWSARITDMLNEAAVYNDAGILETLNIHGASDQAAVDHMLTAVYRESRRIIQEGDLGTSRAEFAGPIVRTLLQFRSFVLNSHVKQMMYGANMRDAQAGSEFLMSTLFSGIGQMSKYQLMTLGMGEERREEFLEYSLGSPGEDRIAKVMASALRYSSHIGLLPDAVDTITHQAIGQRFFDYRNSGMQSGWIGLESAPAWNTLTAPLQPFNEIAQGDNGDAVRDTMRIGPNYTSLIILGNALQEAVPNSDDRPTPPRRRRPEPLPMEGSSNN